MMFLNKISRLTRENKICKNKIRTLRKKQTLLQQKNSLLKSSLQDLQINKISPLPLEFKNMNHETRVETIFFPRRRGLLKKTRYPPSLKSFASTIHFYSPAAYKYVRRVFGIVISHPCKLNYWLDNVRKSPTLLVKHFKV